MKKKKWLKLIPFAVLTMSALVGAAACDPENIPDIKPPIDGPEVGEYYYDYSDNVEYTVSLGSGNTVSVTLDGKEGSGVYTLDDGTLTFVLSDGTNITMSAIWENDVLTLKYGDMTFVKKVDYTVTFDTNGGSHIAPATVRNGRKLSQPAAPTRKGFHFVGWYASGATEKFVFGKPVTENITLTAHWEVAIPEDEEVNLSFDLGYEASLDALRTTNRRADGLPVPQREGYTFLGWWKSDFEKWSGDLENWTSDFEEKNELTCKVEEGDLFYADATLHAIWQKDGETVTTLSVNSQGITWSKQTQAGTLTVVDADGNALVNKSIGATADTFEAVDFAAAPAGRYTVTFTVGGNSVTRYFNNKALDRVYKFSVDNGNILRFNEVKDAETYIITVDCGDDNHVHEVFDTEGSTSFDFSNCEMQVGGIVFTVYARAEGRADSIATKVTYENLLGKVEGYELDFETDVLDWDGVDNAACYVVTVKVDGETVVDALDIGNKNSFDLKPYTGNIEVSVYAKNTGYVSPEATTYTYNKTKAATPSNLKIIGDILSWDGTDGAAYKVCIAGKEFTATEPQLDLSECDIDWKNNDEYAITVEVTGANSSLASEPFDARYYAMGQTMTYNRNTVSWQPVIGAQSYQVMVNGDTENVATVSDGSTSAEIVLTQAGENTVSVRFFDGENYGQWVELPVNAFSVTLNKCNNEESVTLYYAAGDKVTLPENYLFDGYKFSDWYDVENGGEVMGRKFIDEYFTANSDIELYAYWTAKTYDVGLDFGDYGTSESQIAKLTYTKDYKLPVPQVTDGRKVFKGWSANQRGTNMVTDKNGASLRPWNLTVEGYTLYAIYSDGCEFSFYSSNGTEGYSVKKGADINDITELYIPEKYDDGEHGELPVIYIPDGAFTNCNTLTSVNIPNTVVSIDPTVFSGCSKITGYEVRDAGNAEPKYLAVDGTLIEIGRTGTYDLKAIPAVIKDGAYIVPDRVTRLPISSFKSMPSLKSVTVPASVTLVEALAFEDCSNLTTITFLDAAEGEDVGTLSVNVGFINDRCTSVTEIKFPKHLGVFDERDAYLTKTLNKLYNLEKITVTSGGNYFDIDGVLCQKVFEDNSYVNYIKYCPVTKEGTYVVPDNIQKIADFAFANIEEITAGVPSTSRIIKITDLVIHAGVRSVGNRAFYGNRELKTVTFLTNEEYSLPKTIGYQAFYYCDKLTTVDMQEEGSLKQNAEDVWYFDATSTSYITSIGEEAFGRTAITAVTLPSTLNEIGKNAFRGCTALADLDLSHINSSLVFGETVFNGCSALTEVEITKNVGEVAFGSVFYNCVNLKGFEIDPNSPYYSTDDYGVVYNKTVTRVLYVPDGFVGDNGSYVLPDTVVTVESGVFSNKRGIVNITLSGSVTSIGSYAFENCVALTTVTFTDGEDDLTIGENAFAGCIRLNDLTLPKNTKTLGNRAFYGLLLKNITLNEGLETIGDEAFSTSGIATVEIPSTVASIGANAFKNCASLITLTFAPTPENKAAVNLTVGAGAFYSTSVSDVVLPERLQYVSNEMFRNCSVLKTVSIPSTVGNTTVEDEKIIAFGDYAFYSCMNLTGITFATYEGAAEDMKTVSFGKEVFYGCPMLKTLDLPARVGAFTENGKDLFAMYEGSDFTGAFNVTFDTEIDTDRRYAAGLTDINIDGNGAFVSKDGIVYTAGYKSVLFCPYFKAGAVEIDRRAETFEPNAFRYCKDVTAITFEETPEGETAVDFVIGDAYVIGSEGDMPDLTDAFKNPITNHKGTFVFQGCTSLETIVFPARLKSIGDYAFTNHIYEPAKYGNALKYISFADGCKLETIGKHAFDGSVLVSIDLPANLKTLEEGVFDNCVRLKSITLSNSMGTEILERIIADIPTLTNITVPDDNPNFSFEDGVIYNKDKTALLYVLPSKDTETYFVPDTVTRIATRAFAKVTLVKNVVISPNDDGSANLDIEERAFEGSGITSVSLSSRVKSVGAEAFLKSTVTSVSFENWNANSCTELPDSMFKGCAELASIAIPATVTTLGSHIFDGCSKLASVTFDDAENAHLTDIGVYAFASCSSLKEIALPKNVTSLGAKFVSKTGVDVTTEGYTFSGCSSLTKVTLSDKIEYIGTRAFENCSSLVSVKLPLDMVALGGYAFTGCSSLTEITFNSGTPKWDTMGQYVFSGCTSLQSITFPESVSFVNQYITEGCNALKTVTFEGGCEIGSQAFRNLPNLETFTLNDNGVAAKLSGYTFQNCSKLKNVTLGDNLTYIGSRTFEKCTSLTTIDIPAGVVHLMDSAFIDCTGLTTVNYNAVYKEVAEGETPVGAFIGSGAFSGCTSLVNFNFKKDSDGNIVSNINLESIGANAFNNCSSLKTFEMPDSVKFISSKIDYVNTVPYATEYQPEVESTSNPGTFIINSSFCSVFSGTGLQSIKLSKNLKSIPSGFFTGLKTLTTVNLSGNETMTTIGNRAFYGTSVTSLNVPASVTKIGDEAFSGCGELTTFDINVKVPEGAETQDGISALTFVGASAFENCAKLGELDLSATSVKAIPNRLFNGCTSLTAVSLPAGIATIGDYAFNSTKIKDITFDAALTRIGARAFENCTELATADMTNTKLADTVDSSNKPVAGIGNYAFSGTKLASVTLPSTLATVGDYAFRNCTLLTDVKFGGVTAIGAYAFQGCTALVGSEVVAEEGETVGESTYVLDISKVETVGSYAFNGCSSLAAIRISAIEKVEAGAFLDTAVGMRFVTDEGLKFENNILYSITGTNGATAILYVGTEETVNIPENVVNIGENLFKNNTTVTQVILPSSVTNISANAFNGCTNLAKINLDNVITVGASAFTGCTALSKINANDETYTLNYLTTIGASAFKGAGIVNITMPAVTSIAASAFENCAALDTVTINGTANCVFSGTYVFRNSTLKNIDMSAVTETKTTFENIKTLETVKLGRCSILISSMFKGCSALSSVDLAGVADIRMAVFQNCTSLTSVEFDGNTDVLCSNTLAFGGCTSLERVVLKGFKTLGGQTFEGCTALKTVNFGGNTLTGMGIKVFSGCTALEEITIPNSLHAWGFGYIGDKPSSTSPSSGTTSMFLNCTKLRKVTFTGGAQYLGGAAFQGCTALEEVDLTGITVIGWNKSTTATPNYNGTGMFKDCTSLETIDLSHVTYIGGNAFEGCTALKTVTNSGDVTRIGASAFKNCKLLNNVSFPALTGTGTTVLGNSAFEGCAALESFTFPRTLTGCTATSLFKGCTNLKSVTLENYTGTAFASSFFEGCSSLTSFDMPTSVTTVSSKMFSGCSALTSVDFTGSKATAISSDAFLDCSSLETIHIPAGVKAIAATTFKGCTKLKNVIFDGTSVATVNSNAFADCTSLESIDFSNQPLDNNMTTYVEADYKKYGIMANAFAGCHSLKEVKVGNIATLDETAFTNCGDFTIDDVTWTKGGIVTEDGAKYNLAAKVLLSYTGTATSFKVRDGITSIANNAFKDNATLESIDFNNVTSLSGNAFENCTALKTVDLSNITSVAMNQKYIFAGCTSLTSVKVNGDYSIYGSAGGSYMFSGCKNLTNVEWTQTPTKIPEGFFQNCSSLTTIDLSELVLLQTATFEGTGLTEVSLPKLTLTGGVGTGLSGNSHFKNCKSLTKVTLSEVNNLANFANSFEGCVELVEFHAPKVPATGNSAIGASMFKDCTKLATLDVAGCQTVYNYSFQNCKSLTAWTIGNTTTINNYAFDGCTNLTSFDFSNVTTVGEYAFQNSGLTGELNLSATSSSLTLKKYAFAGLGITSVTISGGSAYSSLGEGIFKNCTSLTTVTMSKLGNGTGLTNGVSAFAGCTSLTTVDIPNLKSIGNMMFDGCAKLATFTPTTTVQQLGQYAFRNCTSLESVTFVNVTNKSYLKGNAFEGWTAEQTVNLTGISSNNINAADLNALKACAATVNLKDVKPLV